MEREDKMGREKSTNRVKGILITVLRRMFVPCAVLVAMFFVFVAILDWTISSVVGSIKNWM
jgi:type IV secretory pathway TrbF-like protein